MGFWYVVVVLLHFVFDTIFFFSLHSHESSGKQAKQQNKCNKKGQFPRDLLTEIKLYCCV